MGREKIFETKVKKYIESQGGWQVKFFANKYTRSGVPDILACINGYFVAIEVKSDAGRPEKIQLAKIRQIRAAGGYAFVLYPSAWEWFKGFVEDLNNDLFQVDLPIEIK